MIQKFFAKLTEQERKVFYVTACFVVLALFDFLFMQPVSSKIKKIDAEIKDKTATIKRDVRILSYKNKILKEQEDFRIYGTGEDKAEEEIIAGFLKIIENIVTESKINLVKLNPGEVKPRKGFVEYYANLECDGSWQDMVVFIHKIETTNDLLKISKINISGKKTSADQVTATMSIAKLIIDPKTIGKLEAAAEDPELVSASEKLAQKMLQDYRSKGGSQKDGASGAAGKGSSSGQSGGQGEDQKSLTAEESGAGSDGNMSSGGITPGEGGASGGGGQGSGDGGGQGSGSGGSGSGGGQGGRGGSGGSGGGSDDQGGSSSGDESQGGSGGGAGGGGGDGQGGGGSGGGSGSAVQNGSSGGSGGGSGGVSASRNQSGKSSGGGGSQGGSRSGSQQGSSGGGSGGSGGGSESGDIGDGEGGDGGGGDSSGGGNGSGGSGGSDSSTGDKKNGKSEIQGPNKFDKTIKEKTGGGRLQLDDFGTLWDRLLGRGSNKQQKKSTK